MRRAPRFWQDDHLLSRLLSVILLPLAALYGFVVRRRLRKPAQKVGVGVICAGNIVVGGAGKTPSAIFLARELLNMGEMPFILTRGFGRKISGTRLVDVAHHDADWVGDEALMIARSAPEGLPVIVSEDRVAGAQLAIKEGASVIVMDDGFQNPFLHKDFSFLVIDGIYGFGNGYMLPAGPLRERPSDALARADAIIMIGGQNISKHISQPPHDLVVFDAAIKPRQKQEFSQPLIAFAGMGRPEKFFALLKEMGANIIERHEFSDHHIFREKDAAFLLNRAEALSAQLITTEKDMARLSGGAGKLAQLGKMCDSLPVELVLHEERAQTILRTILKGVCKRP